jgi:hypothetical protein
VSEDERAVRERLAALEMEVKAEAEAHRARKDAALTRLRAERAAKLAEHQPAPRRDSAESKPRPRRASAEEPAAFSTKASLEDLGSALALARRAQDVKAELARPKKKGDKSWKVSAVASAAFGPLGWLYAGSWREAAPAGAAWVVLLYLASWILPTVLLLPMFLVAMPLSGIAGALYAFGHNRNGSRQRLFTDDKPAPKTLGKPRDE